MRNLKLEIEYDGTAYCGWQTQNNRKAKPSRRKSIQEILEKTLHKILREKVRLEASGRTDAGVHARAQIANFKAGSKIELRKLQWALNGLLPKDISVTRILEVPLGFHSRFDAKSKLYRYTILNRAYPSALSRNTVYYYHFPLDVKLMRQEARALVGRHNFKSFQASEKQEREAVRSIRSIRVARNNDLIHIDIEADGFLYNMVRNIAGTLVEIGRGKFARGSLRKILLSRNRAYAGPTVPARGLCLLKVRY